MENTFKLKMDVCVCVRENIPLVYGDQHRESEEPYPKGSPIATSQRPKGQPLKAVSLASWGRPLAASQRPRGRPLWALLYFFLDDACSTFLLS